MYAMASSEKIGRLASYTAPRVPKIHCKARRFDFKFVVKYILMYNILTSNQCLYEHIFD